MKWIVISTLLVALAGVVYLTNYLGYFRPVTLEESSQEAKKILFKKHYGAYHKIVPTIQEVESWARGNGFQCELSFGHYIDDPNQVEQDRLRSRGGCLVDRFPDRLPEGFEVDSIPAGDFVVAKFEGSPSIGPFKVYPRALSYISEKRLVRDTSAGVYEVYNVISDTQMKTTYFFPLQSVSK